MPFKKENIGHTLNGILFVGLFAMAAMRISKLPLMDDLKISPLIIGIVIVNYLSFTYYLFRSFNFYYVLLT